jgi:hypothetical protein
VTDRQAAATNQANHDPPTDPDTGSSEANRGRSPPRTSASGATSIPLLTVSGIARPEQRCGRRWTFVPSRRPPKGYHIASRKAHSSTLPIPSQPP